MQSLSLRPLWLAGSLCLALLSGCHLGHHQSMLHPHSAAAAEIAWLWWFLFVVCTAVFLVVVALTLAAVLRRPLPELAEPPLGNKFIIFSGIVVTGMILFVFLFVSVRTQVALAMPETSLTIRVVGHQFFWDVEYPDLAIRTANEFYIPVGEAVRLELTSADVIHSLWVPNLSGKTDLLPDKVNLAWLSAARPGTYRGQCAEYCGVQHAWMALKVVALPRDEFDAWVAERQRPIPEPDTEARRRGREAFFRHACNNCHTLGEIAAAGELGAEIGPDLTHIGSRLTIGAGLLPNNRGNLAGWISNPQALKPGNRMPRTFMPSEDLLHLVDYLESLK